MNQLLFVAVAAAAVATCRAADVRERSLLRGPEDDAATAPTGELRVSGDGINHVDAAFQKATAIETGNKQARALAAATCTEERDATNKWIADGLTFDKKDRAASKQALAGALEGRVAGLKKFLNRLKRIRARLYNHINRVNGIYGAKYQENMNYMNGAVRSLMALQVILTTPISPKLKPIRNFDKWEAPDADAAAAAKAVTDDAAAPTAEEEPAAVAAAEPEPAAEEISLIEESGRRKWTEQMMRFKNLEAAEQECCSSHNCPCQAGRLQAFELYSKALELNSKMFKNFEAERVVLAKFREGLKKMIQSREANLAALEKQLQKLKEAMNRKEEPIEVLFAKMKVHLTVLGEACAQQQANAKADEGEMEQLVALIKQYHVGTEEASAQKADAAAAATGMASMF